MNPYWEHHADVIFINGSVVTINLENQIYSAMATEGNHILYVGSKEEALAFLDPHTRVIDLKGRTLMPGIIDTHFHAILSGLLGDDVESGMIDTSYQKIQTLHGMLEKLRECVAKKKPGEWISMMGYEPLLFDDEKRHPTIEELDEIAPNNPVHCMHGGGHICMYNSKALEYLNVFGPEDAKKYPKDEVDVVDGKLTGMVRGHTHFWLWGKVDYTEQMQQRAAMKSYQLLIKNGITSIGDMGECGKTSYHIMQKLTCDREFKVRVNMGIHSIFGKQYSLQENQNFLDLGLLTGLGNEYFRIGPCKFMIDGGSGGPSCATRKPYSHDPSLPREKGWSREEVCDYIGKIVHAECQCTAHAIGDEAIEFMVEGYEHYFPENPEKFKAMRHRIEHCTLVDEDLIKRMAKMNICPSVNAGMVSYLGKNYTRFYGERNKYLGALRTMLDNGVMCSLHSDSPSGPVGLSTIDAAVNRYDRSQHFQCDRTQAVTVPEALRIATFNGAYSSHEEGIKGSLEPGKLADCIVLSDNILKIDPFEIDHLKVDLTMIDGEIVYER